MAPSSTLTVVPGFLLLLSVYAAGNNGEYLKLPLLHKPPFAHPSDALSFDAHRLSLLRSARRTVRSPIVSGADTGAGQYFAALHLGTPPRRLLLVMDTGSDLTWVRCSACRRDCSAHPPGTVFLPRHSPTFSPVHCYDRTCGHVPHADPRLPACNHTRAHSPCTYLYSYVDGSHAAGFLSRETATLNTTSGAAVSFRGLTFGCAFRVSGPSVTGASFNGSVGIMGLGRASLSLVSQLGRRFGNRFTYCLRDYTLSPPPTSYLLIGGGGFRRSSRSRTEMRFTPLLINPASPTFYYVGIEGVAVDGEKLPVDPSVWVFDDMGNGGTILDSGTTLTFLPASAYRLILAAFRRRVKLPTVPSQGFDLCVRLPDGAPRRWRLPRLVFELAGKSALAPPPTNYFIDVAARVKCLAIQPVSSAEGFAVIGNLMQQGFVFEFDNHRSRLGFGRQGCAAAVP